MRRRGERARPPFLRRILCVYYVNRSGGGERGGAIYIWSPRLFTRALANRKKQTHSGADRKHAHSHSTREYTVAPADQTPAQLLLLLITNHHHHAHTNDITTHTPRLGREHTQKNTARQIQTLVRRRILHPSVCACV